ncbi:MAG: Inositol 2-dehydrogenase/D-chiro-inositol 3-dehydrogenase [Phycisphaerae bacterium]|nr:Inositol 2-dehydrogenase/D-chiro-inositol 3-dehydrogenase [Phycisphaerae bacterium]
MLLAHQDGPRLNVAVVGCGGHAYRSILPCFDYLPLTLVACVDPQIERARACARQFGGQRAAASLAEALAPGDVQGVLLVVGPRQHPDLACEALAAGLHVWLEKPPAQDAAGVQRMIEAQRAAAARAAGPGPAVVVGFKKAFMPVTRRMKKFLAEPRFGAIQSILARFPMDVPPDGSAVLAERRFTNWLGNGIHPLSTMIELGGRPRSVVVHRAGAGGGFVVLQFASGAVGCLHLAEGSARSVPFERYEVICEHGHMVNENNARLIVAPPGYRADYGLADDFTAPADDPAQAAMIFEPQHTLSMLENKAIFLQGFVGELDHWATAALGGRAPTLGTLQFALSVMQTYEAALLSDGRPVPMPE